MKDLPRLRGLMIGPPAWTLAVAESVTCGGLQQRIGRISGASTFFRGGMTAYTLDLKARYLDVDPVVAEPVNCVSPAVADQMAVAACARFDADLGVATTGYAEPSAEWSVAQPFAYWAIARRDGGGEGHVVASGRVECPGETRAAAQDRICDRVLEALARWLATARAGGGR